MCRHAIAPIRCRRPFNLPIPRRSSETVTGALLEHYGVQGERIQIGKANENGDINCRPWVPRNGKFFSKAQFQIDIQNQTITCPA